MGLACGAAAALLLAVIFCLWELRADTRFVILSEQFPEAVIVQPVSDAGFRQMLSRLQGSSAAGATLVLSRDALSIYGGGRAPALIAIVLWADVTVLADGGASKSPFGKSMRTVRIAFTHNDAAEDVSIGLYRQSYTPWSGYYFTEVEIAELIARVDRLRNVAPLPPASPSDTSLTPGITAWTLSMWFRPTVVGVVFSVLMVPYVYLILIGGFDALVKAFFAILLVGLVVSFVGSLWAARVDKREAAAGYTTLNRVHLDREQRHPRSGLVVRSVGQPPLSKQAFQELLRR